MHKPTEAVDGPFSTPKSEVSAVMKTLASKASLPEIREEGRDEEDEQTKMKPE